MYFIQLNSFFYVNKLRRYQIDLFLKSAPHNHFGNGGRHSNSYGVTLATLGTK